MVWRIWWFFRNWCVYKSWKPYPALSEKKKLTGGSTSGSEKKKEKETPLRAYKLFAVAYRCGLTAADIDNWDIGFLIDYINEYINDTKRINGKNVIDVDEKYIKMKKIQPIVEERYKSGDYPPEKYNKFMEFIQLYESETGWFE